MSNSEIRPALTPEEWNRKPKGFPYAFRDESWYLLDGAKPRWFIGRDQRPGGISIHGPADGGDALPVSANPALAALALHGQEFGFTWADVDLLRKYAVGIDGGDDDSERTEQLDNLANRIEALLPPESGK